MKKLSIKAKVAMAVGGCLVALAIASALMGLYHYHERMRDEANQAVKVAAQSFFSMEKREIDKLSTALDALVGEPAFASLFALRDRDHLLEAAAPIFKELRTRHHVTHWYFIDPAPSRTCFLRVHRPELHDDVVGRQTLLGAIRTGDTTAGKELGQTAFALRVVRPFVAGGKLLGYMELGQEIDDFLTRMRAETGDDLALVIEKKYLDEKAWAATRGERRNNWNDDAELVVVDVTSTELPIVGASADVREMPDDGRYLTPIEHGSRRFVRGVLPVRDVSGQRVGALFVLHDVTALRERAASEQLRAVLLIGVVAFGVFGVLFVIFEVLVFRRLARMTKAMEDVSVRLAGGDYDVGATIHATTPDEIGRFETFLGNFLSAIGSTLRELEKRQRRSG